MTTCRGRGEQGIYEDMTATAAFRTALPSQLSHPAGRIPVRVRVSRRARRLALKIDAVGDAVELVLPPRTSVPRALNFLKSNRDWLETRLAALPPRLVFEDGEKAREEVGRRVRRLALQLDRKVRRITVRDTTTRWGSCSASGNLAFSWRLIMAPEAVLHYVVAHEAAHLVEMNHGARFWKLVDRLVPHVERQRDWLNRNRAWLLRIG